jgi:hypothetical protein
MENIEKILNKIKKIDQDVKAFSLKIPQKEYEELKEFCKKNRVSINSMINGLIKIALEEIKEKVT